jgi:2-hydroxy-6-oxonona-2,4-dienedioate hydrolase
VLEGSGLIITWPTGKLKTTWTSVGGLRMHARVSEGSSSQGRPAVVLVHGLVVSGRYMVPAAERLAAHYRIYVPDLPGFGKSEKPSRALSVAELSGALEAWMREVGLGRVALVGNSFGCQIIADLAVRHPSRVERAVLQGPTMDPRARAALRQLGRLLLDTPREPPSLLPIELLDYLSAGTARAWRTLRYALEDRIEDNLPRAQMPTLIVRGERDPIAPQRWAEEAARLLPEGWLVVIPGAAHAVNYGAPSEFTRVVRAFLDTNRQPPATRQDV